MSSGDAGIGRPARDGRLGVLLCVAGPDDADTDRYTPGEGPSLDVRNGPQAH